MTRGKIDEQTWDKEGRHFAVTLGQISRESVFDYGEFSRLCQMLLLYHTRHLGFQFQSLYRHPKYVSDGNRVKLGDDLRYSQDHPLS